MLVRLILVILRYFFQCFGPLLLIKKGMRVFRRWNNLSYVAFQTRFVFSQCHDQWSLAIIWYPAENADPPVTLWQTVR